MGDIFQFKADDYDFTNIKTIKFLQKKADKGNLLQSIISSEVLTLHSIPTVPTVLQPLVSRDMCNTHKKHFVPKKTSNKLLFEDKINVNSYNYFEYVHPGYARQVVKSHSFIEKYCPVPFCNRILDVGSGTGSALLLFLELCKGTKIVAIEPSPVAYGYLSNIKLNINGNTINPINIDFLKFSPEEKMGVIMSTGASHHFDTILFLSHAKKLLTDNGILVIADEFVSEFSTAVSRKKT